MNSGGSESIGSTGYIFRQTGSTFPYCSQCTFITEVPILRLSLGDTQPARATATIDGIIRTASIIEDGSNQARWACHRHGALDMHSNRSISPETCSAPQYNRGT